MAAEGHGPAPASWCYLVLGSGGRLGEAWMRGVLSGLGTAGGAVLAGCWPKNALRAVPAAMASIGSGQRASTS